MRRSRFDELHDHYKTIRTTKSGTRYERLAAIVFAAMERDGVVIHDLAVRGSASGVAHQIDVQIEKLGVARRILVECKDFDISGNAVGLGIVRDFQGVLSDTQPDEAWIITCNGFTTDARQYAKGMGIRLATLREFAHSDWENRIHTIATNMDILQVHDAQPEVKLVMDEQDAATIMAELAGSYSLDDDFVQVFDGQAIRSYGATIMPVASRVPAGYKGDVYSEGRLFEGWISGRDGRQFVLSGMEVAFRISRTRIRINVAADRAAARLLLSDVEGLDFVLWEDALVGYTIDEAGEVHLADEGTQKRLISTVEHLDRAS